MLVEWPPNSSRRAGPLSVPGKMYYFLGREGGGCCRKGREIAQFREVSGNKSGGATDGLGKYRLWKGQREIAENRRESHSSAHSPTHNQQGLMVAMLERKCIV